MDAKKIFKIIILFLFINTNIFAIDFGTLQLKSHKKDNLVARLEILNPGYDSLDNIEINLAINY